MSSIEGSKPKYGFNPDPRLSANQLGEYLIASPTRRKTIVRDAKFPKTAMVARYEGARGGIADYLCDLGRKQGILFDAIDSIQTKLSDGEASDWKKNDCHLSIEAIQAFQHSYNSLGLNSIECRPVFGAQPKLSIEGVDVSVSLDATTHRKDKKGNDIVGGVILLFSKAETSGTARKERCTTSAVLAAIFAEKFLSHYGKADPKICFSVDVFGGKSYKAPNTYKKKLDNMHTSCEEIALRWPITEPPADYDGPPWQ